MMATGYTISGNYIFCLLVKRDSHYTRFMDVFLDKHTCGGIMAIIILKTS
jgi:hypothetical protein